MKIKTTVYSLLTLGLLMGYQGCGKVSYVSPSEEKAANAPHDIPITPTPAPPVTTPTPPVTPPPKPPVTPPPVTLPTIRINAGSDVDFTDSSGRVWQADQFFTGGTATNRGAIAIGNTNVPELFRTEHYGEMHYEFKVPLGLYKVSLFFAETYSKYNFVGARTFNVNIENQTVLTNFDVFAASGQYNAMVKIFDVVPTDGGITIDLLPNSTKSPEINAIEIVPK